MPFLPKANDARSGELATGNQRVQTISHRAGGPQLSQQVSKTSIHAYPPAIERDYSVE